MTILQAALLGAIQGLTEFLPISSSGHLVLFQQILGVNDSGLTFDVVVHLATLIAILVFFGKSLLHLNKKELWLIGIGTIPAVIAGLLFKDEIEAMFASDKWLGLELIITGGINFYIDRKLGSKTKEITTDVITSEITPKKSLLMGISQAVAIIPGISRSGATVATGVGMGLDREQAFRFSFLLAIPALAGAGVLQLVDLLRTENPEVLAAPVYAAGAVSALVFGILSLKIFRHVMSHAQMSMFGWYCVILGVLVLAGTFL